MPEVLKKGKIQIFLDESISAAKNRIHAKAAEAAGEDALARLLNAVAAGEEIRAERVLMRIRGKTDDLETHRIKTADEKKRVISTLYPRLIDEAESLEESSTYKMLSKFRDAVKNHCGLLQQDASAYRKTESYYICQVCGYVAPEAPPERCPACSAIQKRFFLSE